MILYNIHGEVIHEMDCEKMRELVEYCVRNKINLTGADLTVANLTKANLTGADLTRANLTGANLTGANLTGADLTRANLIGADLTKADLTKADLIGADLTWADLTRANLTWADLTGANLTRAYLTGANLTGANLTGADLTGADLLDSINYPLSVANTRILPDDGDVIGWKKCKNKVLVKLLIPADAKRNNAFGRKCRANKAIVLDIIGADEAVSDYDDSFKYRKGETVEVEDFDEKFWNECSTGIHFFITRLEAENY